MLNPLSQVSIPKLYYPYPLKERFTIVFLQFKKGPCSAQILWTLTPTYDLILFMDLISET